MNTLHQHLFPEFQFRVPLLASSAKRLIFFLVISLVLHGLILSFIPSTGASNSSGKTSRRAPVIISLESTPTHHDRRQKPHRARPESPVTKPPAEQPTDKLVLATKQTHMTARSTRSTTRNNHHKNHIRTHSKPRSSLLQTTKPHHHLAKNKPATSPTAYTDNASQHTSTRISTASPSPDPAAVAALLRTALRRHFHYPIVALQNNWQGKVVLGMRVSATGLVQDAQILKTSGIRILDRAAQHSANAIGYIPAARPLLAGKSLRFRIPVNYRLQQ